MTDTVSETEVSFEVWQDGDMVAAADSLADAEHFMLVYGQDGPVEAKTAITTRLLGFNVVTAMLAASPQGEGSSADEAVVDRMVQRFLSWRLPEDFNPDNGISFKPTFNDHMDPPMRCNPTGTNLFDALQAKAMVRYILGDD